MDHHTNWRYREELATQLIGVLDLCTPEHARANVAPIALALLDDRVAAVREAALPLVSFSSNHFLQSAKFVFEFLSYHIFFFSGC
jgi:hypothetical protein